MEAVSPLIIPGLPNDLSLLCLLKVPRIYHACLASVCIAWRNAVRCPEFYHERRRLGSTDAWLVLISTDILSTPSLLYSVYDLSTRQLLFKVRFPPSLLPVDRLTPYVKTPARGVVVGTHFNASYNAKFDAPGKMPLNVAHESRFAEGMAASSVKVPGSMSVNAASNNKAMSRTSPNAGKCDGRAAAPNVNTWLHNLDHYRIVAMNEYFAVLGFTQRSRSCPAICTFAIYNTVTNECRHTAPLSICREMFACGVIDGRLYVAGGWNEKGEMERTTEVYDFGAEEWGTAEALPEGIGRIQGDVVYQGKLYVQCREAREEGKCVVWVYEPKEDKWEELKGREVGGKQLIATDEFMYAIGGQEGAWRYEASSGKWKTVGTKRASKLTGVPPNNKECRPTTTPLALQVCRQCTSQTAFGNGNDIFVVQANGVTPCGLPCDGFTKCYILLAVTPTWYHAGAVVKT